MRYLLWTNLQRNVDVPNGTPKNNCQVFLGVSAYSVKGLRRDDTGLCITNATDAGVRFRFCLFFLTLYMLKSLRNNNLIK